MRQKGFSTIATILIFLVILGLLGTAAAYFLGSLNHPEAPPIPPPPPEPPIKPTITESLSPPAVSSGWQTYQNQKYGFAISYPEDYQALDDQENLYGYPQGVVLLYQGGQAYDIIIEVWDNQSDYEGKYASRIADLTVKKIGQKFLTLLDNTQETENNAVIATFKTLD